MTVIYTPQHITAASELREACANLHDALDHEPLPGSALWDDWNNNSYQPAYSRHVCAEATYAHLWPKDHAPHTLDVLASHHTRNRLQQTLVPNVWGTEDQRFLVGPYLPSRDKEGKWAVEFWADGIYAPNSTTTVLVDAADKEHAQQIVELITWATGDGARNGED